MDNNRFIGKLIISNIVGLILNSDDDDDFNFLGCPHVTHIKVFGNKFDVSRN